MNALQAIEKLKQAQADGDPEEAHIKADEILCEFLSSLGHADVVEAWNEVSPKWYA
jgi:hypothetical protein